MYDLQTIADRMEIEVLRAEYNDAAMMNDKDRLVSLFTDDAVYRIPDAGVEQVGLDQIRTGADHLRGMWEFFLQNTHPGVIILDGDTASGRTYAYELGKLRDGRSMANYGIFHDHYRRTPEGWKFSERSYEIRYLDTAQLTGSPEVVFDTSGAPAQA